jgi:hypothetical protein
MYNKPLPVTVYRTISAAEDIERKLNDTEEDGWNYKLTAFGSGYAIACYDDQGKFLGHL